MSSLTVIPVIFTRVTQLFLDFVRYFYDLVISHWSDSIIFLFCESSLIFSPSFFVILLVNIEILLVIFIILLDIINTSLSNL
jgi:hypothetical protein